MDYLNWLPEAPKLRNPTLVVAFEGWNDAAHSASIAAEYLIEQLEGTPIATIDPDQFYDFTDTRPDIEIGEAGRNILWPKNEFVGISLPDKDRDLIVFQGTEPQLQWRLFVEQFLNVIEHYQVELVISMGALIAEVVHSRPSTIYSTSEDATLIEKLNLEPSSYEGPTGIVGVLQDQLKESDCNHLSLWVTIPGYVPHIPSPKGALTLVKKIAEVIDTPIPTSIMELNSDTYEAQISELVTEDEQTQDYVQELEGQYDDSMRPESGAELVEELEQFLKERDDDPS